LWFSACKTHSRRLQNRGGNATERFIDQAAAGIGQRKPDDPLILLVARSGHQAGGFQTLDQRGEGVRLQMELPNASYRAFLTRRAMDYSLEANYPADRRKDVLAFPLRASLDQLAGLPAATVIVAENDLLRDEGEAYGRRLLEAGVPVAVTRYNGTIHDFVSIGAIMDRFDGSGADDLGMVDFDGRILGMLTEKCVRKRYADEIDRSQRDLYGED